MKYIVDESYLNERIRLFSKWKQHSLNCSIGYTEFCDCGLDQDIVNLNELAKTTVKPITESNS